MAGGAEEDQVFEGIEIGKLGNSTAMEIVELTGEVNLDDVTGSWRTYEGEVCCINDTGGILPVKTA